jgi:hypothetical protein
MRLKDIFLDSSTLSVVYEQNKKERAFPLMWTEMANQAQAQA